MKPESLVELIGSGNSATVEEEWMSLIEASDTEAAKLATYHVVLRSLCDFGAKAKADALAWAAIETLSARMEAADVLIFAGPFLLAIGESEELRKQVSELYRKAHGETEGFEALLTEAGLGGGRPVRRALRTLDVCLNISEGSFLANRHEEGAARVESVDRSDWMYGLRTPDGEDELGAVHLADNYRPAREDDFAVERAFAAEGLRKRLKDDPMSIVIDLCRHHNDRLESDVLESTLIPDLLGEAEWKKWLTKLRAEVRKNPRVTIEGRSPFTLIYTHEPESPEEALEAEFQRRRDPVSRFELVEEYLRECKVRGRELDSEVLSTCQVVFAEHADRLIAAGALDAGLWSVIALQTARNAGSTDGAERVATVLHDAADVGAVFSRIHDDSLHTLARECLIEARPDDWADRLMDLLPTFPMGACDWTVHRTFQAGKTPADLESPMQRILASPVECFEALLWLWNGPAKEDELPMPTVANILSRVFRGLDEARRSDTVDKDLIRRINGRARAVLAARRYERFNLCLDQMQAGVAAAFRNQLKLMDSLGRVVRDDLVSRLTKRFPPTTTAPAVMPWDQEDAVFSTADGLARKQKEIDEHVNVKMKQNAIAIGEAAERGDLSENSEYKFALEERDLLRARLGQMNAEVAGVRVFSIADVPTDHIGIGTQVTFRRITDGETYRLAFVGPWEADGARGWINYKAPLAQSVLGKRIGDQVEFTHSSATGTYEIVELTNALIEEPPVPAGAMDDAAKP